MDGSRSACVWPSLSILPSISSNRCLSSAPSCPSSGSHLARSKPDSDPRLHRHSSRLCRHCILPRHRLGGTLCVKPKPSSQPPALHHQLASTRLALRAWSHLERRQQNVLVAVQRRNRHIEMIGNTSAEIRTWTYLAVDTRISSSRERSLSLGPNHDRFVRPLHQGLQLDIFGSVPTRCSCRDPALAPAKPIPTRRHTNDTYCSIASGEKDHFSNKLKPIAPSPCPCSWQYTGTRSSNLPGSGAEIIGASSAMRCARAMTLHRSSLCIALYDFDVPGNKRRRL
ncbi:hypothetical protein BKA80DRAFT_29355 [Phyllosticta citrichinensis]